MTFPSRLIKPNDHLAVVEMLIDPPSIALTIGTTVITWTIVFLEPADPLLLKCLVAVDW
jgi:hypothetical protein